MQIHDAADAHAFIFGGKACFTLKSLVTGTHYTYEVEKAADSDRRFFVRVLTGGDNTSDFTYIGFIDTGSTASFMNAGKKGNDRHNGFIALWWFLRAVEQSNPLRMPATVEFYHEGKCARCKRKLTTPESLRTGLGPECRKMVA